MQDPDHPETNDVFIGVDVGKGRHHAVAFDRGGKRLLGRALPNSEAQRKALIGELRSHRTLLFVGDQPASIGALPIAVARAEGIAMAYLPGLGLCRIADRHDVAGKTDARDAAIIAEAARSMPHALRALRVVDDALVELMVLDDDLVAQITQVSDRLRGLLMQIHPALEGTLGPLERYPTPAAVAAVGRQRLIRRLKKPAPRMAERLAEDVCQALSEQHVFVPGTEVAGLVVPRLVPQLSTLRTQREDLSREVEVRVHAHPLCPVLISLPGDGIRTATRLLTEIVCRDFHSGVHLAAYAGLSPVTRRSGSSIRGEHPSRRGNRVLKQAPCLSAFVALRDPVSLAYHEGKVSQCKRHKQALIALARRRCDVLFGMVRDPLCQSRCRFDPSVILGALRNDSGSIKQRIQRAGVARLLPRESSEVFRVSQEIGVSVATLERWRGDALSNPARELACAAAARRKAVIATASMDDPQRSAWCRDKGVFPSDLAQWREGALAALAQPEEAGATAQETGADRRRIKELEKELRREEKGLAETTELLVLRKKLQAIFQESEDE